MDSQKVAETHFESFQSVGPLDPLDFVELLKRLLFRSRIIELLKRHPVRLLPGVSPKDQHS
jgi:hypothetical protein